MGGAKKRSLAQAEKQQALQSQKEEKQNKKKSSKQLEKKISGIDLNIKDKEIDTELAKMKAITPYTMASRFNLKLSIAKDFLESLEKVGKIKLIAANNNIKVYKFGTT